MKFMRGIFSLSVLMVVTAACGNQQRHSDLVMPAEGTGYTRYELTPALQCSGDVNIEDLKGDSAREYRACNPNNAGTLKLYPALGQSETVCVFPASGQLPVLNAGIPVAKCGALSPNGNSISFTGLNFNAVYVVKYEKFNAMANCLKSNHPAACAQQGTFSYAYGLLK